MHAQGNPWEVHKNIHEFSFHHGPRLTAQTERKSLATFLIHQQMGGKRIKKLKIPEEGNLIMSDYIAEMNSREAAKSVFDERRACN